MKEMSQKLSFQLRYINKNVIVVPAVLEPTISFSESWFQLETGKDQTTSKPGISFVQHLNEEQCLPAISKVDKVDKADKVSW